MIKRARWIIALAVMCLMPHASYALHASRLPYAWHTYQQAPVLRRFIVNLPLARSDEWFFRDRKRALAGELILLVAHKYAEQRIIIFKHGQFMPGWHEVKLGKQRLKNSLYFQFASSKRYLSAPDDDLTVIYITPYDLTGQDAYFTGVLAKGRYVALGEYSGLTDEPDVSQHRHIGELMRDIHLSEQQKQHIKASFYHLAYCSHWQGVWPVKILNHHGWLLNY